jgi:hypothetical protein
MYFFVLLPLSLLPPHVLLALICCRFHWSNLEELIFPLTALQVLGLEPTCLFAPILSVLSLICSGSPDGDGPFCLPCSDATKNWAHCSAAVSGLPTLTSWAPATEQTPLADSPIMWLQHLVMPGYVCQSRGHLDLAPTAQERAMDCMCS